VRVATAVLTGEVRRVVNAGADDKVLEGLYTMPEKTTGQNLRAFSAQTTSQHEHSIAALWRFSTIGLWAEPVPD
jgi:hypothetical protein